MTSDILLNSRMTNSPCLVSLDILIAIPSVRLFHSLDSAIVCRGTPVANVSLSSEVRGCSISCFSTVNHRDCSEHKLNTSGYSCVSSVDIVRSFFSLSVKINFHLTEVKRDNSPWISRHHL